MKTTACFSGCIQNFPDMEFSANSSSAVSDGAAKGRSDANGLLDTAIRFSDHWQIVVSISTKRVTPIKDDFHPISIWLTHVNSVAEIERWSFAAE